MSKSLIIINPNSSTTVTDGIDAAIEPLRSFGVPIKSLTLAAGPKGIESQRQADLTIAPMLTLAAAQADAAGYVSPVSAIRGCMPCAIKQICRWSAFKKLRS